MFGYDYVNLTQEQVQARRIQLDRAGLQAYLTPIIVLFTIYAYRQLSSQFVSTSTKSLIKPTKGQLYRRQLSWMLTNSIIPEFGPINVQLVGITYGSYLLYLIIKGTGNDYMHVTKAFGHVAVSQLPLHYLLSIKSPKSPITLATGLTHERLNAYHRLFGRIIHALLATHAVLYLRFFAKLDILFKRIKDWDVRYGLIAFWSLNILAILAIPPIRKRAYHKIFYRSHVILSAILVVVIWLHVPYTRKYIGQAGLIWLANGFLRNMPPQSSKAVITCKNVGSNLIEVTASVKDSDSWKNYQPGMHCYLNQPGFGPKSPFTIVDVISKDDDTKLVKFVVRNLSGPSTKFLDEATKARPGTNKSHSSLTLEGPYGEAQIYMPDLLLNSTFSQSTSSNRPLNNNITQTQQPKTLLVAGGVGATYTLPIYTTLLSHHIHSTNKPYNKNLKLIWIAKSHEDIQWGLSFLQESLDSHLQNQQPHQQQKGEDQEGRIFEIYDISDIEVDVEIFITQSSQSSQSPHQPQAQPQAQAQAQPQAQSQSQSQSPNIKGLKIHHLKSSRPNLTNIIDSFITATPSSSTTNYNSKINILLCGPTSLSQSLRTTVGNQLINTRGMDVRWYEEVFGFGG